MPPESTTDLRAGPAPAIETLALAALEAMDSAVFIADAAGTIRWVNAAFTELTGWPAAEAIGSNPRILRSGFQDRRYYESFWASIKAGAAVRTHVVNRTRTGELYAAVQHVTALCDENGTPHHYLAIQRTLAPHEIQGLDGFPVAVVTTDPLGRIRSWNRAAVDLLGWHDNNPRGTPLADAISGRDAREEITLAIRSAAAGHYCEKEVPLASGGGTCVTVRLQLAPQFDAGKRVVGLIAALIDVSEEVRLRAEILQTERMEATGRLAASVAHDVNNHLTAIALYAKLARESVHETSPVRDDLREIESAAERTGALARRLLIFSRKQALHPTAVELSSVVRDLLPLLRHAIREDIELEFASEGKQEPVWVDVSQVEQILVNLVVNARDAMPEGGAVRITTAMRSCPGGQRYGVIDVADTGVGMTADICEHIFEPFFTTKGESGTGLGLATVHGIVTQNGGRVVVESSPGHGTTFRVAFPVAAGRSISRPGQAEGGNQARTEGKGRVVLVVDDDPNVREVVRRVLEAEGYLAIVAGTPAEAVTVARDLGGSIDLVVADVVLPDANGPEVVSMLARAGLPVPALFMSGYAHEAEGLAASIPPERFLAKPFAAGDLLEAVARTLTDSTRDLASERVIALQAGSGNGRPARRRRRSVA